MKKKEITIKDLAEILLPKLWIVAIISILASVLAFVYSSFVKVDTYTDSSLHYVYTDDNLDNETTTGDNLNVAQGMIEIYKTMLEGEIFLTDVVLYINDNFQEYKDITQGISIGSIRSMMTISQHNDTSVFSVSVTSTSPVLSSIVLTAINKTLISDRVKDLIPNTFKISSFKDPTDPADAKSIAPNNKHEARNAVLSFLIAAVVSVVAIWVYSFFDVVIRDKKKLIDNVDVPILGVIPRHDLPATTKGGNGKNA